MTVTPNVSTHVSIVASGPADEVALGNAVLDSMIEFFEREGKWVRRSYFGAFTSSFTYPEGVFASAGDHEYWGSELPDYLARFSEYRKERAAEGGDAKLGGCLVGAAKHLAWLVLADHSTDANPNVWPGYNNAVYRLGCAILRHRTDKGEFSTHAEAIGSCGKPSADNEGLITTWNDDYAEDENEVLDVLRAARAHTYELIDRPLVASNTGLNESWVTHIQQQMASNEGLVEKLEGIGLVRVGQEIVADRLY